MHNPLRGKVARRRGGRIVAIIYGEKWNDKLHMLTLRTD